MTDLHWILMFGRHWKNVDPSIRKLTQKFSREQMLAINGIACEAWNGDITDFLRPETVEDAIGFAITVMFEMSHPELAAYRETIH